MKIYILAGEASGDIHAAGLIKAFKKSNDHCDIRAMGGEQLGDSGAEIAFHYSEFAIMGFVEVLKKMNTIRGFFKKVEADIRDFSPDFIVFVDFSGFNLRMAKRLYGSFELHYYIAPKAWAWNKSRVHSLAKYCKSLSCIFPFEESFFRDYNINAKYVGNPSVEQIDGYKKQHTKKHNQDQYIALFPGSRKQEVERILPIMLAAIRKMEGTDYKISKAPNLSTSIYLPFLQDKEQLISDNYALLYNAHSALVTSGTATLETALFGIPQVVCYIANPLSYWIARSLVKLKYISLVNLIADKPVVKELIQSKCNPSGIHSELLAIMDGKKRQDMLAEYNAMREILGTESASENTKKHILQTRQR